MRSDARRGAPMSEINVTPLVDVMLVLLIIFMVAAPMLEQGIPVMLPKAATSERLGNSDLVITLNRNHVLYIDRQVVTLSELRGRLAAMKAKQPVRILADRNAYVSKLVELWDLCRDAGFREIHIATLSEEP